VEQDGKAVRGDRRTEGTGSKVLGEENE